MLCNRGFEDGTRALEIVAFQQSCDLLQPLARGSGFRDRASARRLLRQPVGRAPQQEEGDCRCPPHPGIIYNPAHSNPGD